MLIKPQRIIRILCSDIRVFSNTMSESIEEKTPRYDGRVKKRKWESRIITEEEKRLRADFERIKRRKFALLLSYSGINYFGMQRNPGMKTIEEDLLNGLLKSELITEEAFKQIQTIQFQRAARTDKGVSAAQQVVSLKLPETITLEQINLHLPEDIRVFSFKRVTKGFNSKSQCDARTYMYLLPTFSFASNDDTLDLESIKSYRSSDEVLEKVNSVLKLFVGTKNFHNFTSKKKFIDPSANRYIVSFECEKPFISNDIEFAIIKVKGQSFMLHQIRKMIGLALAVVRGLTGTETIEKSWTPTRIDVPMAPGLGLVLDQVHYDRYNERYGKDGIHDKLDWMEVKDKVQEFKEKHIYPNIIETEIKENSMFTWLQTLPLHTYDVREGDNLDQSENDKNDNDASSDNED